MKKIIAAVLMLGLLSSMTSAYYVTGYESPVSRNIPSTHPFFENYQSIHGFQSDAKYRRTVKTIHYQRASSPFVIVHSPYGKKPWSKPYGDQAPLRKRAEVNPALQDYNPFYGFPYLRSYHCHGERACHTHNIFPAS